MTGFKDHFSAVSSDYARYRPAYPDALIRAVAEAAPGRDLAWDCATGTGQVAVALGDHFVQVIATDASREQVAHAAPHPRVSYRCAPAEAAPLADASTDLVTVAQALHWFDREAFFDEAGRVLRPGGVLAVWTYERMETEDPAITAAIRRFHDDVVGPWWPPERALVGAALLDQPFPFEELPRPSFEMAMEMSLPGLLGYLGTWSAVRRCREATGTEPMDAASRELAPLWGEPERERRVRWPLTVRMGRAR